MANTLITPTIVAKEALLILTNSLVMKDLVHNDFSNEFTRVGNTVNIRVPASYVAKNFVSAIDVQSTTESYVPVKMDRHADVSVEITSKEQTLDLNSLSEQIIKPAMIAIAQKIDEDIANAAVGFAGSIASATASPTDLADIAGLAKTLDINKAPMTDRHLVLCPEHKYRYALTDNLSKVSYAGANETLREALLGRIYGFNTYMDQNIPNTNAAVAGTATAYKVAGTKGASVVALSAGLPLTDGTVKIGDGFVVDGRLYRFTADATINGSGVVASVAISPALHATITATDAVLINDHNSVAFHRGGLAFVSRPLEIPEGAVKASNANAENISVRVVYSYDITNKKDIISFDVLYGLAKLNENLIVSLAD